MGRRQAGGQVGRGAALMAWAEAGRGPASLDRRPRLRLTWALLAGFTLLIAWSAVGTSVDPATLLGAEGRRQMGYFWSQLFPPALTAEMLGKSARGSIETIAISLLGTLLAVALAFPLAILSSRNLLVAGILHEMDRSGRVGRGLRGAIYAGSTLLLNFLRSIPEVFWALIFILAVGLGPFPGVLALGFHNGGVLGKLYSEVLEDVNPQPIEALHAAGAGSLGVLFYGMLPQAFAQCVSYTLYRWEVNIRAATIIGVVGAGGIGREVYLAISLFHYHDLLTLLVVTFVMVTVVDSASAWIRRRLV
ncbi:MAG: phosphonate ABC transporter, permease protein PhnE [Deltaproteobacteria bacterium]|nr:phosphonate ABC transporter, permease protein PhnE [Deltaproteobacteria bacterium]